MDNLVTIEQYLIDAGWQKGNVSWMKTFGDEKAHTTAYRTLRQAYKMEYILQNKHNEKFVNRPRRKKDEQK